MKAVTQKRGSVKKFDYCENGCHLGGGKSSSNTDSDLASGQSIPFQEFYSSINNIHRVFVQYSPLFSIP